MQTRTEIEKEEIKNKVHYIETKENLLIEYKALAQDLEFAIDDVEKGLVEEKRKRLASEIKKLSSKIKEIENLEKLA